MEWLRGAEGRVAVADAATLVEQYGELAGQRRLRRRYDERQTRAAVALIEGRRAARPKFADAGELFCDRAAAEQASSDVVARHTASRFARYERVADLACGMGGDSLALAEHADVLAVDRDPARLAMLAANAGLHGLDRRITRHEAGVERWETPADIEALWCDPSRRGARGRLARPESWSPPLSVALRAAASVAGAGIKLAPGIDPEALPVEGELEFISHERRLVEAVLWVGELAGTARRATVLPEGESLQGGPDAGATALGEPGQYLYDPDPAVGRASLVDVLASRLGARKLDERIAYLTNDARVHSLFARRFRVHAWLPFSERRLFEQLRAMGAGRVEVMRRGSPVETNPLERRLNEALLGGSDLLTVALTRLRDTHIALVLERERD